jgi:hypothetical protein
MPIGEIGGRRVQGRMTGKGDHPACTSAARKVGTPCREAGFTLARREGQRPLEGFQERKEQRAEGDAVSLIFAKRDRVGWPELDSNSDLDMPYQNGRKYSKIYGMSSVAWPIGNSIPAWTEEETPMP